MIEVIGLIVAFLSIFMLRARKVGFATAIFIAAVIIGLTAGKPYIIFVDVLAQTLTDPTTWTLFAAVGLISVLGYALGETGLMQRFIESLHGVLPSNLLLAIIPALFGFLSMPGGALLSAPFLDPEADRLGLKPEHKTYYNVWFRHLLYWMNPITSSTIMVIALSDISLNDWLRVQSPLFFVMTAIGFVFSRDFIQAKREKTDFSKLSLEAMKGLVPILFTVVLTVSGQPIYFALLVGIVLTYILGEVQPDKAVKMFVKGIKWEIVLSVISMLYLRDMVITSGTMTKLFEVVLEAGIPIMAIIVLIPLLIGAISGSPAMGVGIGFPLLIPLIGGSNIHLISIIFIGIICAYITSPLHLCLVLSNSYYKSDLNKVIRYLAPSCGVLYIIGVAYHLFLNRL